KQSEAVDLQKGGIARTAARQHTEFRHRESNWATSCNSSLLYNKCRSERKVSSRDLAMFKGSGHNPTGRFDGLAGTYARYRPDYPRQAIDWINERLPNPGGSIVDVGCGTGISSRQLAERGCTVIGMEPNESMRAEAEATPSAGNVQYRAGR